jgi:AcrR family transcriptional regulator
MREGKVPSMQDVADRALVSLATAYRYFRTAEDLMEDATAFGTSTIVDTEALERALAAAGDDVEARVEALVQVMAYEIIDQPVLARQAMRAGIERWFAQQGTEAADRATRAGMRNKWIGRALDPLRGELEDFQLDSIAEGLAFVIGVEAVITLLDVLGLSPDAAKERTMTTARWILRAGLDEARHSAAPTKRRK